MIELILCCRLLLCERSEGLAEELNPASDVAASSLFKCRRLIAFLPETCNHLYARGRVRIVPRVVKEPSYHAYRNRCTGVG